VDRRAYGEELPANADLPLDDDAERAAVIVRHVCRVIASRAELDHSDAAATIFHERIRKPWHLHSQKETRE
jgi:hypothetical protein